MKILVIGGMHGNEPLGLRVVKLLAENPLYNVDWLLANEMAVKKNCRYNTQDLNRSFPGNIQSRIYEEKRAAELLLLCREYDLVLDFHNTYCPNNDCTFVGTRAKNLLYDVSSFVGLQRVIVADYPCINKFATNCLSIEISLSSQLMDANYWVSKIVTLASTQSIQKQKNLLKYKFVYRITLKDKVKFHLEQKYLQAFKPIAIDLANSLGVMSPAYPIFIADKFTPYNYGGLLNSLQI